MGMPAVFDQDSFEGYDDDGGLEAATSKNGINGNWTQDTDENFRIRFLIQETSGTAEDDLGFDLEYNLAGAGWNAVTGSSSVVRVFSTPNYVDGSDTAQDIGSGTFVTGEADDVDGSVGDGLQLDFAGNDETEIEFCMQIRSVDVLDAQTIQFRITESGVALDTITNTPTVTVNVPPVDTPPVLMVPEVVRGPMSSGLAVAAFAAMSMLPPPSVEEPFPQQVIPARTLAPQRAAAVAYQIISEATPPEAFNEASEHELYPSQTRAASRASPQTYQITVLPQPPENGVPGRVMSFVPSVKVLAYQYHHLPSQPYEWSMQSVPPDVEVVAAEDVPEGAIKVPDKITFVERANPDAYQVIVTQGVPDEPSTASQLLPSQTRGPQPAGNTAYWINETFVIGDHSEPLAIIPDRTQPIPRSAVSAYWVSVSFIPPDIVIDEPQPVQVYPDRTQAELRAAQTAYDALLSRFVVGDEPTTVQVLPDRTRGYPRASESAYQGLVSTFVVNDEPVPVQVLPERTLAPPRAALDAYAIHATFVVGDEPVPMQVYPVRTFAAAKPSETAYALPLSTFVVNDEPVPVQILPDRTLAQSRASETAYSIQFTTFGVEELPQDLPEGSVVLPKHLNRTEDQRASITAYDALLSTFVIPDEPSISTQLFADQTFATGSAPNTAYFLNETFIVEDVIQQIPPGKLLLPEKLNRITDSLAAVWVYSNVSISELVVPDEPSTATQLFPQRTTGQPRAVNTAYQIVEQFNNPDEPVTHQILPSRTIGQPRARNEAYEIHGETFPSPDRPLAIRLYPDRTQPQPRAASQAYVASLSGFVEQAEPSTATQLLPSRTQSPLRAAVSTYVVSTRLIEPDETPHVQHYPDRTQPPLRAPLTAYEPKFPTFPVLDVPDPTQIYPDRTQAPLRAALEAYQINETFVVPDEPPMASVHFSTETEPIPRASSRAYVASLSELAYEDAVQTQLMPDRTQGPERASQEAYSAVLSPVVYEEIVQANPGSLLLPDQTKGQKRAATQAYEIQVSGHFISGEEDLIGDQMLPATTRQAQRASRSAYEAQLSEFVIPGEPRPVQLMPVRTQDAQRPAASAYEITQTWFDVSEEPFPRGDVLLPVRTQSALRAASSAYIVAADYPPADEPSISEDVAFPSRIRQIPRAANSAYFISASIPGTDVTEVIPVGAQIEFRLQPARMEYTLIESKGEFRLDNNGRMEFVIEEL